MLTSTSTSTSTPTYGQAGGRVVVVRVVVERVVVVVLVGVVVVDVEVVPVVGAVVHMSHMIGQCLMTSCVSSASRGPLQAAASNSPNPHCAKSARPLHSPPTTLAGPAVRLPAGVVAGVSTGGMLAAVVLAGVYTGGMLAAAATAESTASTEVPHAARILRILAPRLRGAGLFVAAASLLAQGSCSVHLA